MHRRLVAALMCMGFAGLSCDIPAAPPFARTGPPAIAENGVGPSEEGASPDGEQSAYAPPTVSELQTVEHEILDELRSRHTGLSENEIVMLARTIVSEAKRWALDPALVVAVIHVESNGYHLAVSPVGALGLMQLLPSTGEELAHKLGVAWHGPDSLFDPIVNVKLGTAYLRELSDRYDSMDTALAAYNWGPGRIDRRLRRGASVPSRYIGQVMRAYESAPAGRS
jgi:soluble lytic murein transglycosylase-like protein